MTELRYPNESREYRDARDALLKDEQELVDKLKSVAARRRELPPGGQLKEDYVFQWANDGTIPVLLARPWSMGLIDPGIRSVATRRRHAPGRARVYLGRRARNQRICPR